jgi:hypothetical protein
MMSPCFIGEPNVCVLVYPPWQTVSAEQLFPADWTICGLEFPPPNMGVGNPRLMTNKTTKKGLAFIIL